MGSTLPPEKISVAVLFGGSSGEHEVSLKSASSVISALDREKYHIVPVGITRDGRWLAGGDPMQALKEEDIPGDCSFATPVINPSSPGILLFERDIPHKTRRFIPLDAAFPVLHGPYGEDGTIQGLLEMAGLPYVGGGVLSCATAMDKAVMKVLFSHWGLPLGDYTYFTDYKWRQNRGEVVREVEGKLGYPCFIKPANMGSSVGVSKVNFKADLEKSVELALNYDHKVIVEEHISGREIEVSVLGSEEPAASLPGEIVPCNEFYDFRAKYIDERSELLIPAPLSEDFQEQFKEYAVTAFKAVGGSGMGRVDFFFREEEQKIYVNEINNIPGFTEISMYPKLWEASGVSYSQLLDKLIGIAFERDKAKQELAIKLWEH